MHAAHNYLVSSNTPLHHILPRVMWSILSAPRPTGRTAATKYPTFIRSSRRRITSAPSRGRAAAPRGTKVPQRRGGRLGVTEDDAAQPATLSGGDDVGSGQRSATTKKMTYTYLGGNSWLLYLPVAGVKVLCDPWLIGDLTFWDLPMLYTGRKSVDGRGSEGGAAVLGSAALELAATADVVLLSQGWEDHAHRPTLRAMPKDIPVVASPAAADVARDLGFEDVTALRAGARKTIAGTSGGVGAVVRATAGALVGPPWSEREAGFIVSEQTDEGACCGMRVYYEPHCSYDTKSVVDGVRVVGGRVDVAITPVRSVDVAGFPLVSGGAAAVELLEVLGCPAVVLPLRNGELAQEGLSAPLLGSDGTTAEEFGRLLAARPRLKFTRLVMPEPGVAIQVHVDA